MPNNSLSRMQTAITVFKTGPLEVNTLLVPLCAGFVFVTDPGGDSASLARFMEQHSVVPAFIICTHGHFDHVLGLSELSVLYPDAPLGAGTAETGFFGEEGLRRQCSDLRSLGLEGLTSSFADLPPVTVPLSEGQTLAAVCKPSFPAAVKEAAAEWTVLHTPGHSAGSICLYSKNAGILLSGDTLFYRGYGRTDLSGGDESAMVASLRRLFSLPKSTLVYPGHGKTAFRLDEN